MLMKTVSRVKDNVDCLRTRSCSRLKINFMTMMLFSQFWWLYGLWIHICLICKIMDHRVIWDVWHSCLEGCFEFGTQKPSGKRPQVLKMLPGIWYMERAGCWSHPAQRKQIQFWDQFISTTACLSSQRKRKTKGTCVAPLWVWLPWKKLDPNVTMWKASAILATVSWLNAQSWWWRPWPWPWPWITDLLKTHLDHESVVGEIWNIVARLPDVHRHIRLPDQHDDDKDAKDDNDNNGDDKGDTLRVFY